MSLDFGSESAIAKEISNLRAADSFLQNVTVCPHCLDFHADLEFRRLPTPKVTDKGECTHSSECPDTKLQILTGFLPANYVVTQNKEAFAQALGERLKTESMSEADIQKVLAVMSEVQQTEK